MTAEQTPEQAPLVEEVARLIYDRRQGYQAHEIALAVLAGLRDAGYVLVPESEVEGVEEWGVRWDDDGTVTQYGMTPTESAVDEDGVIGRPVRRTRRTWQQVGPWTPVETEEAGE